MDTRMKHPFVLVVLIIMLVISFRQGFKIGVESERFDREKANMKLNSCLQVVMQ